MNIINLIKEEQSKINPLQLSDNQIIDYIIDYLYDLFGNSFDIKEYKQTDNIKEKQIKIYGIKGPFNNKYFITLELTFNILSKLNAYNIDNVIIDYSKEPGLYKDNSEGRGYNTKQIKSFDKNFYSKLINEIKQQFRFDVGNSKFKKSIVNPEEYPIEYDLINNRYRIEKSFIDYVKNILDTEDIRKPYISKLKLIVDNIIKNNYYSSEKTHNLLKKYLKGNL
jgi:hypothetical protein